MSNSINIISSEIRKYLTSSLVFTCHNCMVYKYEGSESFYEHKEISNEVYDFIVDTMVNLSEIFKYEDEAKLELSGKILEKKFKYSEVIFDYYLSYFNLEFIKKVYFSDKYIKLLEKDVKAKVLDINKYIRDNSQNVFVDYMPYFLQQVSDVEFNKVASTISHEFDRFTFEQIQNIFKYDQVYFNKNRLDKIYNGYIGERFAISTVFAESNFMAPESSEKLERVMSETERDIMDVISDLTLLYECLNDLNILVTFITDEAILFDEQLVIKDIFYSFKATIKTEDELFVDQLFELLDRTIEQITDEDVDNTKEIVKILNSEKELDEDTEKLLYILNILKTVYSEDIFDYFVSDYFFEQVSS